MIKPADRNLTGLPAWARDEILRLRESVDYWQSKIATMDAGTSGIHFTCDHEHDHNLPAGAVITFRVNIQRAHERLRPVDFAVRCLDDGLGLDVRAEDGGLIVEPMAANAIVVKGASW